MDCGNCKGMGYKEEWQKLRDGVRGLMRNPNEVTILLAGRPPDETIGHDVADTYEAMDKIIAAVGLPADWQKCEKCAGSGELQ